MKILKSITILIALLMVMSCASTGSAKEKSGSDADKTVNEQLEKELLIYGKRALGIDLRTARMFAKDNIVKSINIPLSKLQADVEGELKKAADMMPTMKTLTKDSYIVVWGTNSVLGAKIIKNAGYKHVLDAGTYDNFKKLFKRVMKKINKSN